MRHVPRRHTLEWRATSRVRCGTRGCIAAQLRGRPGVSRILPLPRGSRHRDRARRASRRSARGAGAVSNDERQDLQRMTIPSSAIDLADLVARWIHVIAGIMWIGNSMLFNWLDRSLRPSSHLTGDATALGDIWLLHSGGFYFVEKTLLAGKPLPSPLHWFKWQAYTT